MHPTSDSHLSVLSKIEDAMNLLHEEDYDEMQQRYEQILASICELTDEEADLIEPKFSALENELLCLLPATQAPDHSSQPFLNGYARTG